MVKQLFTYKKNIYLMVFLKLNILFTCLFMYYYYDILHFKKITEFSLFITPVTLVLGHDKHKLGTEQY